MKDFVILTDSACALPRDLREEFGISEYLPMHYVLGDKEYLADIDWEVISAPNFYNAMREGAGLKTSQVNAVDYRETFTKYLEQGKDILYLACSGALSASIKSSLLIRDELLEKYPDAKIICIDGKISGWGLGLLCIRAGELKKEGKNIDEIAEEIDKIRLTALQEGTAEKLTYLKRAGRVSGPAAFFGGLLSVKPIIVSDANGMNIAIEKVKGRKNSLDRLVERFKEQYVSVPYQRVFVLHGDSLEEGMKLKEDIINALPESDKNVPVRLDFVDPIVGGSTGPGTMAIYFYGKEMTLNKE